MQNCPAGTYMPRYGARLLDECVPCPAGFKCDTGGIDTPTLCDDGYACPTGSLTGQSPEECQPGMYCPTYTRTDLVDGTSVVTDYPNTWNAGQQLQCPYGFYTDTTGKQACDSCPAGQICGALATDTPTDCPDEYVCPQVFDDVGAVIGGSAIKKLCPQGQRTEGTDYTTRTDETTDCLYPPLTEFFRTPETGKKGDIADGYLPGELP